MGGGHSIDSLNKKRFIMYEFIKYMNSHKSRVIVANNHVHQTIYEFI
jgi:hypothetical protein